MEAYRNFTVTMDHASEYCSCWANAETGEEITYATMMIIAAHMDDLYPLDDRSWYIVFPDGEIALLNEDFDEIMPLFKPLNSERVETKFTGDEFVPPQKKSDQIKYCIYCGEKLRPDSIYCLKCGKKVN
jgi:hypothetical protein